MQVHSYVKFSEVLITELPMDVLDVTERAISKLTYIYIFDVVMHK